MTAIAVYPLCSRDQTAAVGYRDFIMRHFRARNIASILIDVERKSSRMQAVPATSVPPITAHKLNSISNVLKLMDKALKRADCPVGDMRRCT